MVSQTSSKLRYVAYNNGLHTSRAFGMKVVYFILFEVYLFVEEVNKKLSNFSLIFIYHF